MLKKEKNQLFLDLYARSCAEIDKISSTIQDYQYMQSAHTSYLPLWVLALQNTLDRDVVVVLPSDEESNMFTQEINTYQTIIYQDIEKLQKKAYSLPSWGLAMGSGLAQYATSRLQRSHALHSLVHALEQPVAAQEDMSKGTIVGCSVASFFQLLPPRELINSLSVDIRVGEACDPVQLAKTLSEYNFLRTPNVTGIGEFSIRGEIIDISMYDNKGVSSFSSEAHCGGSWRIRLDFERIESIERLPLGKNYGDTTHKRVDHIKIYPLVEHIWNDKDSILKMDKRLPETSSLVLQNIRDKIEEQHFDEHDYLYYPFVYKKQAHITQYCNNSPLVLRCKFEDSAIREDRYKGEYSRFFLDSAHVQCVPRPERVFDVITTQLKSLDTIRILSKAPEKQKIYAVGDIAVDRFGSNVQYFEKKAVQQIEDNNTQVVLCSSGEQQRRRVELLLSQEFVEQEQFFMDIVDVSTGFYVEDKKQSVALYTEADIWGKKLFAVDLNSTEKFASIDAINEGDVVVHIQYGIGIFCGLIRKNIQGAEKDFMRLQYQKNEMLYVPIEQMNMVQRYIGKQVAGVKLDRIGGKGWSTRKRKVIEQVEDISEELLVLQAQRKSQVGFAFPVATEWEKQFINQFPYPETKDQTKVWREIEQDMVAAQPMDRLLVGDVGFGKTELAFRAAFKAMSAGKQVVFLVPTTILAEQHYHSALKRFEGFPVSIRMLSRFVEVKEQNKTLDELAKGKVDFLIGTHKVLQPTVKFIDIGLVLIDEEHRFGVKHKEVIKKIKTSVDCLALSATPIPRTMYQSLVQIRQLSTLETPPNERKPIKTMVERYSDDTVKRAIEQELERKGQVFFLHNRIQSLNEVQTHIQSLVPSATILTASGQMDARELEQTMYTFVHGGANILISTTIIENGIDIPTVNTIIIDRADMYGVSQLYQLRGRVGRSDKTAYAYLLYPDENRISDLALKRLTTISDHTELGSGFKIAMRDLEVRGAGNLLGKEQSGSIFAVGYEYYLDLLNKAIQKASGNKVSDDDVILDLHYTGFIPSSYVSDPPTKMDIYRRLARIKTQEQYDDEVEYLEKTYGDIPDEVENLLCISKIKIIARKLQISTLKDRNGFLDLHLNDLSFLTADIHRNIVKLIEQGKIETKVNSPNVLVIPYSRNIQLEEKHLLLKERLASIGGEM